MWYKPFIQSRARELFTGKPAELRPSCVTQEVMLCTISSCVPTSPKITTEVDLLIKSYEIE